MWFLEHGVCKEISVSKQCLWGGAAGKRCWVPASMWMQWNNFCCIGLPASSNCLVRMVSGNNLSVFVFGFFGFFFFFPGWKEQVPERFGGGNCHLLLYSCAPVKPGDTLDIAEEVYREKESRVEFYLYQHLSEPKLPCRQKYSPWMTWKYNGWTR